MRVLVTGGAGFLGSHLIDRLLERGDEVVCVDDLSTGRAVNVAHLDGHSRFRFVEADCSGGLEHERPGLGETVDAVAHLASPASPPGYMALPVHTLKVGSLGTFAALERARADGARFLITSTSEVYGDPTVHPQPESYWGNVNPIGPRSVYDEAKRFAEAATMAYHRTYGVDTRIARLFNTYGPRMAPDDGRVVTNLICQALRGEPLTVYGDGSQTRSFGYVDDTVRGVLALLDLDGATPGAHDPVNLGNPGEFTVGELAAMVLQLTGADTPIEFRPLPADDPLQRKPVIDRARDLLGWQPIVPLAEGLPRTIEHLRAEIGV